MKLSAASKSMAGLFAIVVATSACASDRGADSSAGALAPAAAAGTGASLSVEESFGTLSSPCGPGEAAGSTDQGVSDSEIRIGYGDDRGYSKSPGLNKEIGDAVSAMIDWCNAQGGINGRTIVGTHYDAAMTQANAVMQNACASEFMMVGHGFAMDQTSEQTRVACNLAAVPAFTVSPDAANGPMTYQGVPFPVDYANGSQWFQIAEMYPDLLGEFDVIDSTMPTIISASTKIRSVAEAAGFTLKNCGVTLNYEGESSYAPFAEKFKQCGVKGLWTSRSPVPAEFNFVKALDQAGIDPILLGEATWYGNAAQAWNGENGLLDNLHAGMTFQMIENADAVPAVKKYVELVTEQDGKTALLGMQATSSFLLWATAADACGSDLSRQCVIDELSRIHEWDGGGLHAVTDPGNNMPATCGLVVKLEGAEYTQAFPAEAGTFECDDRYRVATDPSTWGTELGPDRIATKYLNPNVIRPTV